MAREVQLAGEVEHARAVRQRLSRGFEEDGFEVAQLARDQRHLRWLQFRGVSEYGETVAAIRTRAEDIDVIVAERREHLRRIAHSCGVRKTDEHSTSSGG